MPRANSAPSFSVPTAKMKKLRQTEVCGRTSPKFSFAEAWWKWRQAQAGRPHNIFLEKNERFATKILNYVFGSQILSKSLFYQNVFWLVLKYSNDNEMTCGCTQSNIQSWFEHKCVYFLSKSNIICSWNDDFNITKYLQNVYFLWKVEYFRYFKIKKSSHKMYRVKGVNKFN